MLASASGRGVADSTFHTQRRLEQELFRISREQDDSFDRSVFGDASIFSDESLFGETSRFFDRIEEDMRDSMARMDRLSREAEQRQQVGGPQTYRKENASEEKLAGGGYRRTYSSESVTVWSGNAPVYAPRWGPTSGTAGGGLASLGMLVGVAALGAYYVHGCRKLLRGYGRTVYRDDDAAKKVALVLGWPVLRALSESYRAEYDKATADKAQATPHDDQARDV